MNKYKILVVIVAVVHIWIAISLAVSAVLLPFYANYFVALPLIICIIRILTSNDKCVLTELEKYLRKKAGMYVIRGFVGHYFLGYPSKFIKYLRGK